MHTVQLSFLLIILWACIPLRSVAQWGDVSQDDSDQPTIMILGTYHMASTTSNVINVEVDDVTSKNRQDELQDLAQKLARYAPNKIALECDFTENDATNVRYADFLAGDYELTRNEIDQIGFRLAKHLGHERVYCVDWGIFPDDPLYNYESYSRMHSDLNEYLNTLYAGNEDRATESAEEIASQSIIDNLINRNNPERTLKDHTLYYRLLRIGRDNEYVGANYLTWWYGRNMKILANILRFTDSKHDRILVVYGSGHNTLLNQFASESGFYEVIGPLPYLIK